MNERNMDSDIIRAMMTYRARNRLSQSELAKRCGISRQTLWAVENGRNPNAILREKIKSVVCNETEQNKEG